MESKINKKFNLMVFFIMWLLWIKGAV